MLLHGTLPAYLYIARPETSQDRHTMDSRLIVQGWKGAYFARRSFGWAFMPCGPRGMELVLGLTLLNDEAVSAFLGCKARIVGDTVRMEG